jgi:deoxyribodipyrimidine photolyase-related protein
MWKDNFWNHSNQLTNDWYEANTGILPLDDSIKKAQKWGYTHHIERLMVQSNIMLLSEMDPREVYKWFMEMYVDSADWVMMPNVFGMGQFSEGGIFATKPYISGSNYIKKMSNYGKGDWCETLDGLYWRFISENKKVIAKNQRMSMMVAMLDKMDKDRKKRLFKAADKFLSEKVKS